MNECPRCQQILNIVDSHLFGKIKYRDEIAQKGWSRQCDDLNRETYTLVKLKSDLLKI